MFREEQDALVEWLRGHQIGTVAMEATGTVPAPKRALRKRTPYGPNAATVDFSAALARICGGDWI